MPNAMPSASAPSSVPVSAPAAARVPASAPSRLAACCRSARIAWSGALLCLLLAGCALPRIGVYADPLSGQEHLDLGKAYEQKGELDLARREYAEAVRDDVPLAHLFLANVLFQKGELEEAERHYRSAVRLLPEAESAPARNNLAWLLLTRGGQLDEAERLAEEAVRLADDAHRSSYEDTLRQIRAARNK
jgi:tetratricopeptide (TPR) repeat protein